MLMSKYRTRVVEWQSADNVARKVDILGTLNLCIVSIRIGRKRFFFLVGKNKQDTKKTENNFFHILII